MSPNERLDEELFCLSNWLSLNPYEQKVRQQVVDDFQKIMGEKLKELTFFTTGSYEHKL